MFSTRIFLARGVKLICVRPIPLSSVRFWLDRQVYEFMDSKNKMNKYLFYVLKPFFEVFLWSLEAFLYSL